jgi:Zn-dependent metalloprotease
MSNPGALGFNKNLAFGNGNSGQPDSYDLLVRYQDAICRNTTDAWNGCVHFNSGIVNKAAWLMANGGTHAGSTVAGIGREKLARIVYRTLVVYLSQTSDLNTFATSAVQACSDLANGGITTLVDCDNVRSAFRAVGLTPDV